MASRKRVAVPLPSLQARNSLPLATRGAAAPAPAAPHGRQRRGEQARQHQQVQPLPLLLQVRPRTAGRAMRHQSSVGPTARSWQASHLPASTSTQGSSLLCSRGSPPAHRRPAPCMTRVPRCSQQGPVPGRPCGAGRAHQRPELWQRQRQHQWRAGDQGLGGAGAGNHVGRRRLGQVRSRAPPPEGGLEG